MSVWQVSLTFAVVWIGCIVSFRIGRGVGERDEARRNLRLVRDAARQDPPDGAREPRDEPQE